MTNTISVLHLFIAKQNTLGRQEPFESFKIKNEGRLVMKWKITYETMEGEKKVVKFECNADDLLALMNRMIVVRDGRVITNIEKKKGD